MRKVALCILSLFIMFMFGVLPVSAVTIGLYDWAFYVDGSTYEYLGGDSMPATGTLTDGLGTLTWTTNIAGSHNFIAFFDHEIDEPINTFFNEYGLFHNSADTGQSWEIDEPGYVFGDIYDNVLAGALDNTNGVPPGWENDVSMAMGWNFSLTTNQTATITLQLTDTAPAAPALYLSHTDHDSGDHTIYYSSALDIRGGTPPPTVPEPGTFMLLFCSLAGLVGLKKRSV